MKMTCQDLTSRIKYYRLGAWTEKHENFGTVKRRNDQGSAKHVE